MNFLHRRWVVSFLLPMAAALSLRAQAPSDPALRSKLGSTVFAWEDVAIKPGATKAGRSIVNRPTATLDIFESHVTSLNPGVPSHPPHRHAQEEFIILREGTLEVTINGRSQVAGPGSLLFYASNDFHHVRNVGKGPATYLVFNYRTVATAAAPERSAAESAAPGTLRSSVFDWEKLAATATKTGERRGICHGPTVTLRNLEAHVTTLRPGEAPHASHRHPDEELIVVKEGLMEATINGRVQRAGPGSVFFFASNDEHGLRNVGSSSATYHVVRMVTAATPKSAIP